MIDTPIFDALRSEMTPAPLCQVCGRPELRLVADNHWLLCGQCWMMGYGYPENRKAATCADCGKFPVPSMERYVIPRSTPDRDGCTVDFLCREHFEKRQPMSA